MHAHVKVPGPVEVHAEPVAAQLLVPPPTPVQLLMASTREKGGARGEECGVRGKGF